MCPLSVVLESAKCVPILEVSYNRSVLASHCVPNGCLFGLGELLISCKVLLQQQSSLLVTAMPSSMLTTVVSTVAGIYIATRMCRKPTTKTLVVS